MAITCHSCMFWVELGWSVHKMPKGNHQLVVISSRKSTEKVASNILKTGMIKNIGKIKTVSGWVKMILEVRSHCYTIGCQATYHVPTSRILLGALGALDWAGVPCSISFLANFLLANLQLFQIHKNEQAEDFPPKQMVNRAIKLLVTPL